MIYDLNSELDRIRFERRVEVLREKRVLVELVEKKPKRTIPQNSYLHLLIGEFAMRTGNTMDWVKTEYFKRHCNKELFVRMKYDELTKCEVAVLRSSRELDTKEMTTAIDRFKKWAAEGGVDLPDAKDHEWLGYIEREMQHQRDWL
ncbi:MAG: hypothetical protein J6U49_07115 [Alistipes sp.]|nr:hypothetical protein [Alistipes sp.]